MTLQQLINDNYISIKHHPQLPISIYNYTPKTQYNKMWNNYTLKCRGLILDSNNNTISNPFPKFFNYGEIESNQIPNSIPKIFEKLDGSLGIQYIHSNQLGIATRGSFTSPQSQFATKWINDHYHPDDFNPSLTYLYEIIYPENRIVINYNNKADLSLIAVRNTLTGREMNHTDCALRLSLPYTKPLPYQSLTELISLTNSPSNNLSSEGFVLLYPNGFRIKLKHQDYTLIHKIVTDITPSRILNLLKRDELFYTLSIIPDEFYHEIQSIVSKIELQQSSIIKKAKQEVRTIPSNFTQKQASEIILKSEYPSISFAIYNKKYTPEKIKSMTLKYINLDLI